MMDFHHQWKNSAPYYTCPDCGTNYYYGMGIPLTSCPSCKAKELALEYAQVALAKAALNAVANDIVDRVLRGLPPNGALAPLGVRSPLTNITSPIRAGGNG
jgi:ribosomal protein L37AE/L43A